MSDAAAEKSDGLSPFCDPLRAQVEKTARSLFGFSQSAPVRSLLQHLEGSPHPWRILVQIPFEEDEEITLEVLPGGGDGGEWASEAGITVRLWTLKDGRNPEDLPAILPFLEQVRDHFYQQMGAGAGSRGAAFEAALKAYLPYHRISDFLLRHITVGRYGRTGVLRLGFSCNQDCHFCWQGRSWPDPPEDLPFLWLQEFADRGIDQLNITGGEPTLFPALPDLVRKAAHEHGMFVTLETNALRFGRPKFRAIMEEAGIGVAFVSYHSPDAEVSDRMTRAPGTHVGTEKGILALLEDGVEVRLNCVIETGNCAQLAEHASRVVERFCDPFPDNPVKEVVYTFPTIYFDQRLWEKSLAPLDEVRPHLVEAIRTLMQAGVAVQGLGTCGFPPCLLGDTPEAMWAFPVQEALAIDTQVRSYGEVCEDCAMKSACLGVRHEYFRLHGERGLKPFKTAPIPLGS